MPPCSTWAGWPVAMRVPWGERAAHHTLLGTGNFLSCLPVFTSQMPSIMYSPAASTRLPSRAKATALVACVMPSSRRTSRPDSTSHSRTVLSRWSLP